MTTQTELGNNINRFMLSYTQFLHSVSGMTRLYDNGYTAAYYDEECLATYCEGDCAIIAGDNLEAEKQAHLEYYKEQ